MNIYTGNGDEGYTTLSGNKKVKKNSLIIDTLGTLDELSSTLGIAKFYLNNDLKPFIEEIQKTLIDINGVIAGFKINLDYKMIKVMENNIDFFASKLPNQNNFAVSGKNEPSIFLDLSRTVARRAERCICEMNDKDKLNPLILKYINRLSDFLYVLTRFAEHIQ